MQTDTRNRTAMQTDTRRFSSWFRTAADGPHDSVPISAVVQVKIVGDLVSYPNGKSAMIWYGATRDLKQCVADELPRLAASRPDHVVCWRFLPTPAPEEELAAVLGRFVRRFGSVPASGSV
ncbi:MAG: hypothetical protein ACI9WU_005169 [Myxococcota bacterium]|jgi:hypothetical protein